MKLVHKLTVHIIIIFVLIISVFTFLNIKLLNTFKSHIHHIIISAVYENTKNELKTYAQIAKAVIDNNRIMHDHYKQRVIKQTHILFNQISQIYEKNRNDQNIKNIIYSYIKNYRYYFQNIPQSFNISKCQIIEGYIKNTYYKKFQPLNICISIKPKIPESFDLTKMFNALTFGNKNYFFAYKLAKKPMLIIHPFEKELLNKTIDINKIKDIKGKLYKKEIFQKALNGGGFTEYYFKNPATGKIEKKLTYSTYLKDYNIILAVGVYIRDINSYINSANIKINSFINKILCINLLLILVILIISIVFSSFLIKNFLVKPIQNIQKATVIIKTSDINDKDIDEIVKDFESFEKETLKKLTQIYELIKKI